MAKISASQVMDLRKKTGVGMMDAKKALVATEGDFDKAIEVLREKGVAKAEKKSDRVAANGLATIAVKGNTASTSALKEVTLETGAKIMVPLFINQGETITVNTTDRSYGQRV